MHHRATCAHMLGSESVSKCAGKDMAADGLSPTSVVASRRSSFASSTGGTLATSVGKDAGAWLLLLIAGGCCATCWRLTG